MEGGFGHELPRHASHPGGNPCHGDLGKGGSRHRGSCEAQGAKSMYLGYEPVKVANMKTRGKGNVWENKNQVQTKQNSESHRIKFFPEITDSLCPIC